MWFRGRIPKAAFCMWLAIRERLGTQDRLYSYDPNNKCLFCRNFLEDHNHLFFKCRVTSQLWRFLQGLGGFQVPELDWSNLINWLVREWREENFKTISWKLCIASLIYNIWWERNYRFHNSRENTADQILAATVRMIQSRLAALKGVQDTEDNRTLQVHWNLPDTIFCK